MTGIQVLLVFASLIWLLRFLARFRSRGPVRALAVGGALLAISLVLFPDLSVRLAHFVGVTRGVDLVIYLAFVVVGFLWLHLTARQNDLEERIRSLVRSLALHEAKATEARPSDTERADRD